MRPHRFFLQTFKMRMFILLSQHKACKSAKNSPIARSPKKISLTNPPRNNEPHNIVIIQTVSQKIFCTNLRYYLDNTNIVFTFASLLKRKATNSVQKERWQSGRLRRSWKPLSCEAPGVRIPPSPQDQTKQEDVERHLFVFYTYVQACLRGYKKQMVATR